MIFKKKGFVCLSANEADHYGLTLNKIPPKKNISDERHIQGEQYTKEHSVEGFGEVITPRVFRRFGDITIVIHPKKEEAPVRSRVTKNRSVEGVAKLIPPRAKHRVDGMINVIHPGGMFPVGGARRSSGPNPINIDDDTANDQAEEVAGNQLNASEI